MPRSGPRAVRKYSDEFKLTAVRLSLLLRQEGLSPVPADFIAYVRGVPAATTVLPPAGAATVPGAG